MHGWIVEIAGLVAMVLAVTGVWLNNQRRIGCFLLWLVGNSISLAIHLSVGIWSLVVRDAVFLVLAVDGWRRWRKYEQG